MKRASAMKRVPSALAVLATLACGALLALSALHGCAQGGEPERNAAVPALAPMQEPHEWLVQISSAHARADEALALGQRKQASHALGAALDLPVPPTLVAEHVRVVQQDLWYRLAEVDLGSEPEKALMEADRGLSLGRRDDLFTSNLLVARGHALHALGRDTEAASSYQEALQIDERLLQAALGSGPDGSARESDGGP